MTGMGCFQPVWEDEKKLKQVFKFKKQQHTQLHFTNKWIEKTAIIRYITITGNNNINKVKNNSSFCNSFSISLKIRGNKRVFSFQLKFYPQNATCMRREMFILWHSDIVNYSHKVVFQREIIYSTKDWGSDRWLF